MSLALAPQAQAEKITDPDWLEKPNGEDIAEHFPKLAQMLAIEGRALVGCEVTTKGLLEKCVALSEAPVGLGFGPATVELAKTFKMTPKMVDGKAVPGGVIRIPVRFTLPPSSTPTPTKVTAKAAVFGPPSPPRRWNLARKIVAAQDMVSQSRVQFEMALMPLVDAKWPGVEDKTRDDGLEAIRGGMAKFMEAVAESLAQSYAATFSETELADIEVFATSPSGKAYISRGPEVLQGMTTALGDSRKIMVDTARALYCAQHPCSADLPPPKP